jgi:NAD dependent epimerase/dehydratase family enzyme
MRAFREAAGVRVGLPAMGRMLELGAIFMKTETELIFKSRRVHPGLLMESGFRFEFPDWPEAASDLFRQWPEANQEAF